MAAIAHHSRRGRSRAAWRHQRRAVLLSLGALVLLLLLAIAPALIAPLMPPPAEARGAAVSLSDVSALLSGSGGTFTLLSDEIVGANAHLSLGADPTHPVLTFASATMRNLTVSRPLGANTALTITADGSASGTELAIKTSLFSDLTTALGSFTDKADLLTLIAGGTVKQLTMLLVKLRVDGYVSAASMRLPALHLTIAAPLTGSGGPAPTATPGTTATPTPGSRPTPGATGTPGTTPTPGPTPAPTASPPPGQSWLQVTPTSVNLGCGGSATAVVQLRNTGTRQISWYAIVPILGGISVSPALGSLAPGASVSVTLTNTSLLFGHQGSVSFASLDLAAGSPASVSYVTKGCI